MFLIRFLPLALLVATALAATHAKPPNIVLIVADDLGWSDLACYGADLHETPCLDRLALQGMRFTTAYAAAPVCSPTRASIMTGKHPARLHMTIWYEAAHNPPQDRPLVPPVTVRDLPHDELTLAEALKGAGYITAHVGKWHLGDAAHYPESHGFDLNIGGTFWGAPATYFYPYRGPFGTARELRYVPSLAWGQEGEYLTDRLTDEALRIIGRAQNQPFFLHLAYHSVHTPIEAPQQLVEYYRAKLKPNLHHQNPTYAAMVHTLDANVGRVLAKLDQLDLAQNTVVIFISDNGGYVNAYRGMTVTNNYPLRSGKGSLYEGGIRVPLMIRWPEAVPPGSSADQPVVSTDLYPTVLELCGVRLDAKRATQRDGTSLVPQLRDPCAALPRDAIYFHYPHYYSTTTPASAVRVGDWKLIEYFEDGRVELYNLAEDMSESQDVSQQFAQRVSQLLRQLRDWRTGISAQLPQANDTAHLPGPLEAQCTTKRHNAARVGCIGLTLAEARSSAGASRAAINARPSSSSSYSRFRNSSSGIRSM